MNQFIFYILGFVIGYVAWTIFNRFIFPKIIKHDTKELEHNPKWILSRLHYYGFHDIDIILCECKWGMLPRFDFNKKTNISQLWIDNDTSVEDAVDIGRLALVAKIKAKYGLWYPNKSLQWLSVLCYMLDGGDINTSNVSWEEIHQK